MRVSSYVSIRIFYSTINYKIGIYHRLDRFEPLVVLSSTIDNVLRFYTFTTQDNGITKERCLVERISVRKRVLEKNMVTNVFNCVMNGIT